VAPPWLTFNLDGMLDLVEVNYGAPVKVWRNVGKGTAAAPVQMGNWLAVQAAQPGPNLDAIGAWIEVKVGDTTLRRELTVGAAMPEASSGRRISDWGPPPRRRFASGGRTGWSARGSA